MSFIKKIVLFINILLAICLLAAVASVYVNPVTFWFIAFFGLLFPYLLLINVFFVFFWVIVRLKYGMISLAAILLSVPVIKSYFGFHFSEPPKKSKAVSIKVMSYNVRNFDLYNWDSGANTLDKMMAIIVEEKPDVACFQEFFNADSGKYETIKRLLQTAGFHYFSFKKDVVRKNYGGWGVATFSRFPIVNHGEIGFENSKFNSAIFSDIQFDSTIVRVYNAHLQSVYLDKKDYEYLDQVANDQEVHVKPTRQIVSKIKHAFLNRAPQVIKMRNEMSKSKFPVIVCGDFNDTPASFAYRTMCSGLQDAFLAAGWGVAPSHSGLFSAFRIDYIMCDKNFEVRSYRTRCEQYSDHYPVLSEISLSTTAH